MRRVLACTALIVVACGGEKPAPPPESTTPAAAPMPQDAMMPDSMKTRMADTATKGTPAGPQAERPLRDSAYGPSFKIDSTGKVTPIKRP